jgi:23S rRNA pseudouridine1911/1915/1917 synthase
VSAQNQAEFRILGESTDFLAVHKPAGLLVHPTKPNGPRTLWDGLRDLLGYELATGGQISIINRLDRETSGVVLIAKHAEAARHAGLAMQNGQIRKTYLAITFAWPEWDTIEVDAPLLRLGEVAESEVYLLRAVHPDGAASRTNFRVEQRIDSPHGPLSLIRAWPLTGRTHQIRVHLAHVGFPVVGDKLYARGPRHYLDFIANGWTENHARELLLPRHALHCEAMAMDGHEWRSELPSDMRDLLS